MPISTTRSVLLTNPEIPFDKVRFNLNVANGHIQATLFRCRVLTGDVWQDMPGQQPKMVNDAPELLALMPQIVTSLAAYMGTEAPAILNITSRVNSNGQLAAMVRASIPSLKKSKEIVDVYQSSEPLVIQLMPAVVQAVAAANARLQLL